MQEQRQLLSGEAMVLRDDMSVIELSGEDAKKWLHSLTSQNILNLKPGDSTEALLLTPNGHIEHQLKVIAADSSLLIITPKKRVEELKTWLGKMIFRSKVSITDSNYLVFGVFRDLALGTPCWVDAFSVEPKASVRYAKSRTEFPYREYLVISLPDLPRAGLMAYEALRIAAGRPELSDVDERTLPHELDWLSSAVHMSKGCYRGQETVAKVHNLGHPPRRIAILHLEQGDVLCQRGDEVSYEGKPVGKVLAGAFHFEEGSIALALLSRNTPYLDLDISVGESKYRASQEVLVPHDAGKAANLPRPAAFKLSRKNV
ncbi:MAG: folate-binding protein [Actinobacteria bacterium]|nr:folate-binding protein [Actinomycetota bacterium]